MKPRSDVRPGGMLQVFSPTRRDGGSEMEFTLRHLGALVSLAVERELLDELPAMSRLATAIWGPRSTAAFTTDDCAELATQVERAWAEVADGEWPVFHVAFDPEGWFTETRDFLLRPGGRLGWEFDVAGHFTMLPRRDGTLIATAAGRSIVGRRMLWHWDGEFRITGEGHESIVLPEYDRADLREWGIDPRGSYLRIEGSMVPVRELLAGDVAAILAGCRIALEQGLHVRVAPT